VHGLSIPLGKLGFFLPRTLSRAFSSQQNESGSFQIGDQVRTPPHGILRERRRKNHSGQSTPRSVSGHRALFRIGGSVIRDGQTTTSSSAPAELNNIRPSTPRDVGIERTIRFPDEEPEPAHVAVDKSA
jgi:hypothetical protein